MYSNIYQHQQKPHTDMTKLYFEDKQNKILTLFKHITLFLCLLKQHRRYITSQLTYG